MKNRILGFLFIFALVFSLSMTQAQAFVIQETVRYQPNWQIGDTVRYENKIDYSFYSPAYPLAPLLKDRPIIINMTTRHEIIGKDDNSTEFKLTIENIEFENDFLELLLPGWKEEFSKRTGFNFEEIKKLIYTKGIFCYRIDSKGTLIEITHPENYIEFYSALSDLSKGTIPPLSEAEKEKLMNNLFLASSTGIIAQPFNLAPHPSFFMGREFKIGQDQKEIWSYSFPASPFFKKPITLTLNGTIDAGKDAEKSYLTSRFPITEKTIYTWGDAIIPNLNDMPKEMDMLNTNPKKKRSDEIKDFWKKFKKAQTFTLDGQITNSIEFNPYGKFVDQFSYSTVYQGDFYPNRFPDWHTITADPVPFEIKMTIISKKLSENNGKENK